MKFLVDMALSPVVSAWLRTQGHDAVHASEVSLNRAADSAVLNFAVVDRRVIITADLDFPRLLATLHSDGPGLILLRGGNYTEAESRDCVRRVLMTIHVEDLQRLLIVVDKERIRKRDLPL